MFQSKKKLRKSGFTIGLIFNLIFFVLPILIKNTFSYVPLLISLLIILISLINPYILKLPLKYWIRFGNIAAKVNSTLILAIFFYIILLPFALIRKFFKNFTSIYKKEVNSYYEILEEDSSSKMKDQY